MALATQALHEPYAHLYLGDYFSDTLDLSAHEHCALRLLLLETWVRGPVGNVRLASVAGLTKEEWQAIKPAVLPLLRAVQPRIVERLNYIPVENAKVYKELRRGRIDAALASRLSQILINQRVILESWDAQKRIEQLEALLEKAGHGKLLPLKAGNG